LSLILAMSPTRTPAELLVITRVQLLWVRQRIVGCDAAAHGRTDGMEFPDAQVLDELMEVLGGNTGIVLGDRIRVVIAAPRVTDNAVPCLCENRLLIDPHQPTGGRMQ